MRTRSGLLAFARIECEPQYLTRTGLRHKDKPKADIVTMGALPHM